MALRWSGNIEAQRQAREAYARLKPRQGKRIKNKRRSKRPAVVPAFLPYAEYVKTKWWKHKRKVKLRSTGYRCERCGGWAVNAHHKHYRTLWREKNSDLESVCRGCHQREHECLVQADSHLDAIAREMGFATG